MAKVGRAKPPAIMVEKTPAGLRPADPLSAELLDGVPLGALFDLAPRAKRSNQQLGLYWLVLTTVVEATGGWPTAVHLHEVLVRACGFVRPVLDIATGKYREERDSIAFDSMPPADFKVYMDTALAKLSEFLGVDVLDLLPPKETPPCRA